MRGGVYVSTGNHVRNKREWEVEKKRGNFDLKIVQTICQQSSVLTQYKDAGVYIYVYRCNTTGW